MAIQNRRGAYTDFDPTKMVAGEFAVVQSDDPNVDDGKAVYMAFTAGNVKRLATYEDMAQSITDATEEVATNLVNQIEADVATSVSRAETAATNAANSASAAAESARTLTIDDTLTQTGQAAGAKAVGDAVAELNNHLYDIMPETLTEWTANYYIQCPSSAVVGDVISLTPTSGANMRYMIIDVVAGDVFTATGRAATGYKGWFQVDAENKFVNGSGVIYTDSKIEIITPGKLILNANKNSAYYVEKGLNVIKDLQDAETEIREEISELNTNFQKDESILFELNAVTYTISRTNYKIDLSGLTVGDTANLTPESAAYYGYLIIPCNAGEKFLITANAGSNQIPWACLDSDNKVLSIATAASVKNQSVITPANTEKIVITLTTNGAQNISRGADRVGVLEGEYYPFAYPVTNGEITANGSTTTASSYRRTIDKFLLKAGQKLKLTLSAGISEAILSEWSATDAFVQTLIKGEGTNTANIYTFTADRDMYVRYCYNNSNGFTGEISMPSTEDNAKRISNVDTKLNESIYEWERVLNSVCCIGDSLTRGAYFVNGRDGSAIEQNYPYFFGKQTGLTVQNEGLGGSSPSSRWPYFSTFDFTPYNAFFIWWGTNGGLTDTLVADGVTDSEGNLIPDYTTYADTNTGDYCKTIGRIIDQVPHAKIFLATIFTTSATGGASATNAVIEKIAALYPNHVMGIVDCNDGTLYTLASKKLTPSWVHIDNITHFSMVGNYYLAVHWIKAVREIIANNPGKFEDIMEDILT